MLDVPGAHNDRYWLLFLDLEGFVFTEWMAKMKETEKCRLAGTRHLPQHQSPGRHRPACTSTLPLPAKPGSQPQQV